MKTKSLIYPTLLAASIGTAHAGKHGYIRAVETASKGDFKFEISGTGNGVSDVSNPIPAAGESYWVRVASYGGSTQVVGQVLSQILTAASTGLEVNFSNVASGGNITWLELLNCKKF